MNYSRTDAVISTCGKYRYSLTRVWDQTRPSVLFIGLNPSTADGCDDDNTIRKCVKFANSWGFGSIIMINLFSYRATEPKDMKAAYDPVGPLNDQYLKSHAEQTEFIVCAWGKDGGFKNRNNDVIKLLSKHQFNCLKLTKDGHPWHPLYLKDKTFPMRFT